jgi:hypothetical protein
MKNMIFAISAAPAAMPVNPNTPAIRAMMRNVIVQRNIVYVLSVLKQYTFKKPCHGIAVLTQPYRGAMLMEACK